MPTFTIAAYLDGTRWRAAVRINGRDIWISTGRFSTYHVALEIAAGRARALRGDRMGRAAD